MTSTRTYFEKEKSRRLKTSDLSRKGSIDDKIVELINFINAQDCFFSTSSCSGRTIVFTNSSGNGKQGCKWIFVSHEIVNHHDLVNALENHCGSATLKFEPFILHIQCAGLSDAQKLHAISIASGFRNSGITINKAGKIIIAVRSTLSLEVPLSHDDLLLVSAEYIAYAVNKCNEKMMENWNRTERFFKNLKNSRSVPVTKIKTDLKNFSHDRKDFVSKNKFESKSPNTVVESEEEVSTITTETFYDGFSNLLSITS